jgi:hypothetical protein
MICFLLALSATMLTAHDAMRVYAPGIQKATLRTNAIDVRPGLPGQAVA